MSDVQLVNALQQLETSNYEEEISLGGTTPFQAELQDLVSSASNGPPCPRCNEPDGNLYVCNSGCVQLFGAARIVACTHCLVWTCPKCKAKGLINVKREIMI